ncbi:MAG: cytochrome c biogenesis protein CcsA [Bacteroidota bacterium]
MQYIGEHLLPGYIGKLMIILAFITALFSAIFYLKAANQDKTLSGKWLKKADILFYIHTASVFFAGFILLYLLLNRYYEYKYVWIHTENILSYEYLVAGFWAGQEGSFLFWTICQAVFGILILRYSKAWKSNLMFIISLSQIFMTAMMLGVSFGGINVGMSPFLLLREASENIGNPFFANPEYLKLITDGNGLNPLLRNFWMMSHPPILFIGFAAMLIPFAYSIAGLWRKKYSEWIKPALPWTLIALFFMGAGIMLGGVWAFESLTFGGFWAWDPIENASLVPWLILIASLHFMLITKNKKSSYLPTFIFTALSFVFVIYSTYLTRSGVLSDTSVHSFGNDGMGHQILIYLFTFFFITIWFIFKNQKNLRSKKSSEIFTREFWMFVAGLIIILSAFQIIFTTSIPVINKLFGSNLAPPMDVVNHYNTWQTPFAVIIALLLGITHFLKWENNSLKEIFKISWFSISLSLLLWIITIIFYPIETIMYKLLLLFSYFAFISSLDQLLRFKNKYISSAASITHLGFALFLIAVILSFSKQEVISKNTSGYELGNFSEQENLLLIKDEMLPMADYHVIYKGKKHRDERIIYEVDFLKKNKNGQFYKKFTAFPSVLLNDKMGNVFEPYIKRYPHKDIFTYITFADTQKDKQNNNVILADTTSIAVNDTILTDNNHLIFHDLKTSFNNNNKDFNNITITAKLELLTHFKKSYNISPKYEIREGREIFHNDSINELDLIFKINKISEKPNTIELEIYEEQEDFIIIKTIVFPFINLLWLSLIIMLTGILIAFRRRWKKRKIQ